MQTRYMERSESIIRREKRGLEPSSSAQDGQPDRKRQLPNLASVILEARRVNCLQKICSSLEPVLRKVVNEELERAFNRMAPVKLDGRASPKKIEGSGGRNLQLHFRSKLSLPLFTSGKVVGENGSPLLIVLLDVNTGQIVSSGLESSAKLDVVVLEGDFSNDDDEGWSREDFESHVVKEREGRRPLLTGDLVVTLKEGIGTLGELTFTDNSSWIRSRKFRLGLKVASGICEGKHIREAKTDAFTVRDHRGESYKKHYPPALDDVVWRLEKIGKGGPFHKRLSKAGIITVQHFLEYVFRDVQALRTILGSGMSNKMWDALLEHAKTCVLSGKLYVYYPDEPRDVGVVFNNIYAFIGLIYGGKFHLVDSLTENQKVLVDSLVKKAYDNWTHVTEYVGKSPLSSHDQLTSFEQHNLTSHPTSIHSDHLHIDQGLTIGGYSNNIDDQNLTQQQNQNLNISNHLEGWTLFQQNHHSTPIQQIQQLTDGNMFSLSPPHSNMVYVDEIRQRSSEMLDNEDMQHLLGMLNTSGHGQYSFNANQNNYDYSSYLPSMSTNVNFDKAQTQSSGKAIVGWLKLKAVLRWGIFIRKKAAEKRAKIEEFDEL